jgi:superfamily I DNA and/or RNA helicase
VKKLKTKIAYLPDTELKIGTVEDFQGQERQIILVSTVRSEEQYSASDRKFNLGFLNCQKRINVAVSRARSLLVIFGKQSVLVKDKSWKKLLEFSKANGTYVVDNTSN